VSQVGLRRFVQHAAEAAGVSLRTLTDLPTQSDFPLVAGADAPAKSVLAWIQDADALPRKPARRRANRR
jgi:hypothetical protein